MRILVKIWKWLKLLNSVKFIKETHVNHVHNWIWSFWLSFTVLQWMKTNMKISQFSRFLISSFQYALGLKSFSSCDFHIRAYIFSFLCTRLLWYADQPCYTSSNLHACALWKAGFFLRSVRISGDFFYQDLDKAKFRIYFFLIDEMQPVENTPSTTFVFLSFSFTRWRRQVLTPAPSTLKDVEREYSGLQITCTEGCDSACDMSFTVN